MYAAIWRHLPGPTWVRTILAIGLFLAAVFVLFEFVFPAIAPYLSLPGSESSVG